MIETRIRKHTDAAMASHYDAAGGGLDRFQPIVTPTNYPGTHYDSTVGISLSQGDQEGFADRFWGREDNSRNPPGIMVFDTSCGRLC